MTPIKDRLPESIVTERLLLTTPTLAHVPDIAVLANNRRLYEVMARLPFPFTEGDARFFVEHIVPSDGELCYALVLGDVTLIGIVGLTFAEGQPPELGYWLGEPYWGNGYATEAVLALVAATQAIGVPALQSRTLLSNTASRNVLRKAGFTEVRVGPTTSGAHAGEPAAYMLLEFDR